MTDGGVPVLGKPPALDRVGAVQAPGHPPEFLLRGRQFPFGNRQQSLGVQADALFEPQLRLQALPAQAKRRAGSRRQVLFEVRDVALQRVRRFGRRIGQVAEQVEIVHVGKRLRQIRFDELQDAAHRLQADLDVDARRVLDVVARRLQEAGQLSQFRQDPPGAFGGRRIGEQRLADEGGSQHVAVVERVALPAAHLLQLVQARADVRRHDRMFHPLGRRQAVGGDLVQPPREARQGAHVILDGGPAEILQQIVVRVDAVERRVRRMGLVEERQVVVDEMVQRFR